MVSSLPLDAAFASVSALRNALLAYTSLAFELAKCSDVAAEVSSKIAVPFQHSHILPSTEPIPLPTPKRLLRLKLPNANLPLRMFHCSGISSFRLLCIWRPLHVHTRVQRVLAM